MDEIVIEKIRCDAVIGTLPEERVSPQPLLIDISFKLDLHAAGRSDDLADTVDYSQIERETIEIAETSSFSLLEALNRAIGENIMKNRLISSCRVKIFKPGASKRGNGVAVIMDYPESDL